MTPTAPAPDDRPDTESGPLSAPAAEAPGGAPGKPLSDAAKRALHEAEARRQARLSPVAGPAEEGGRDGPEPTRFGDWELKGMAIDF